MTDLVRPRDQLGGRQLGHQNRADAVLDLLQIVRPFKEQSVFSLSPETRDKLQGVNTATLASAL